MLLKVYIGKGVRNNYSVDDKGPLLGCDLDNNVQVLEFIFNMSDEHQQLHNTITPLEDDGNHIWELYLHFKIQTRLLILGLPASICLDKFCGISVTGEICKAFKLL